MKFLQKVLPPIHLALCLVIMYLLHHFLPLLRVIPGHYTNAGLPIVLMGLFTTSLGATTFRKADTPVRPFEPSTTLVTHGLFRFSRNPMYLGMVIILAGAAVFMGTLSPFFIVPVFIVILQEGYIKHEELFMEKLFGETYRDYKSRVRRWL